jgi:hypothetical protein
MGIGGGFTFSHVVLFAYRIAKDWVVAVKLTLYISTHFFLVCISGCAHIAGRQNKRFADVNSSCSVSYLAGPILCHYLLSHYQST